MKIKDVRNSSHRKSERGSVLAYTVLSALFLFFAVGLGADLSHLYLAKTELQNTADASALAGASMLNNDLDRITNAVDRAVMVMNMNKYNFNKSNYNLDPMNQAHRDLVEFSRNLDGPYKTELALTVEEQIHARFVHVKTPTVPINIFFSVPILGLQRNLSAEATAGLSIPGNVNYCPIPLTAIDCGTNPDCRDADGNPVSLGGVCNAGGPAPNPDGSACNPDKQFCKNCTYTIRAQPASGPAPGNYHALCCVGNVNTCNANWLKFALAGTQNCNECDPVSPGAEVPTNPGEMQSAIRDGLNTRFDCYSPNCRGGGGGGCGGGGTNPCDHPPDPNVFGRQDGDSLTWAQYKANLPNQSPTHDPQPNRRVLVMPITPISTWRDANGSSMVEVSSLAGFFLKQRVPIGSGPGEGDIRAEYIGDEVVSTIGFDPNEAVFTNVVTWVLYR